MLGIFKNINMKTVAPLAKPYIKIDARDIVGLNDNSARINDKHIVTKKKIDKHKQAVAS